MTQIHANLDQHALVNTADLPWDRSPAPGVERRRIERNGGEVARLTSIVRYGPNTTFPPHTHGGGEEFFVLQGTFCDEHGQYPAGTYVRNGVGTTHAPFTGDQGCTILVRLWWMHPEQTASSVRRLGPIAEQASTSLFSSTYEQVNLLRVAPGQTVAVDYQGGLEVFVLHGATTLLQAAAWGRWPSDGQLELTAGTSSNGALLLTRQGHLRHPPS